jgi:hypothetical protein
VKNLIVFLAFMVALAAGCKKKEEPKTGEAPTPEAARELPAEHPPVGEPGKEITIQHAPVKTTKTVKVSEDVRERWKVVELGVSDVSTKTTEVFKVEVGKNVPIKNTGFTVRIEAFVPDYTIYEDHIGSKTNEPANPAALVELYEGGKSVAKGWIFLRFPTFNSFRHERIGIALISPAPVAGKGQG